MTATPTVPPSPLSPPAPASRRTHQGSSGPELWLLCALLSLLILAAARGDLWLDEVWSLEMARRARSMGDIFLRLKHDNNHPVNTLFLYLMGPQEHLGWYRLLAVLSGIGSLFLVGHVALKKWGRLEALVAVALVGTSYPLLLYFSEARGYAPAMLCAVAAYAILDAPERGTGSIRWIRRVAFGAVSVLGMLSHASFVFVMIALAAFSLAVARHAPGTLRERAARFLAWHAGPFAAFVGWYWWFLRAMVVGRGPVYSKWSVVDQTLTLLLGVQELRFGGALAVVVFVAVIAAGTARLWRAQDASWVFYPVLLLVAPATIIGLMRPEYFYFRYVIVGFPFFYLLLARVIAEASRRGPRLGRAFVMASVGLYVAGQSAGLI
ncbi:MAG: ArnT family glycosyltransferase, partial [Gemmatimonadaceae bacterium]